MAGRRKICFVTGTRAEFGLMESTLRAIERHPALGLQIVATGMHLDASRGRTVKDIRASGWTVDAQIPWRAAMDPVGTAVATGSAVSGLARAFEKLKADIVLVVGDRVEAFAAAAAAHVSGRVVAHVHGGDRAAGLVDDSLRHAITKLAHLHFPATRQSADRILKLGEDRRRVQVVGSPGIDGIRALAAPKGEVNRLFRVSPRRFSLLVLHPADADAHLEADRARTVLDATRAMSFDRVVVVYPNNDPGSAGIVETWRAVEAVAKDDRVRFLTNVPRPRFLGLLRDAAVLVGNSSSGIIEAASFGTPVVDVGDRQRGRERGGNVVHVGYRRAAIVKALHAIWNDGRPVRCRGSNVYGGRDAGARIAGFLAGVSVDSELTRKLIAY